MEKRSIFKRIMLALGAARPIIELIVHRNSGKPCFKYIFYILHMSLRDYNKMCYVTYEFNRTKLSVPSYSLQAYVVLAFQLIYSYIQCIDVS